MTQRDAAGGKTRLEGTHLDPDGEFFPLSRRGIVGKTNVPSEADWYRAGSSVPAVFTTTMLSECRPAMRMSRASFDPLLRTVTSKVVNLSRSTAWRPSVTLELEIGVADHLGRDGFACVETWFAIGPSDDLEAAGLAHSDHETPLGFSGIELDAIPRELTTFVIELGVLGKLDEGGLDRQGRLDTHVLDGQCP